MGASNIKAKPGKSLEQLFLTSTTRYQDIKVLIKFRWEMIPALKLLKGKKFITFDCFEKRTHLFLIILNSSIGI